MNVELALEYNLSFCTRNLPCLSPSPGCGLRHMVTPQSGTEVDWSHERLLCEAGKGEKQMKPAPLTQLIASRLPCHQKIVLGSPWSTCSCCCWDAKETLPQDVYDCHFHSSLPKLYFLISVLAPWSSFHFLDWVLTDPHPQTSRSLNWSFQAGDICHFILPSQIPCLTYLERPWNDLKKDAPPAPAASTLTEIS